MNKDKLDRDIGFNVEGMCDYPLCDENIMRGEHRSCKGYYELRQEGFIGCYKFFCRRHLTTADTCVDCILKPLVKNENL